MERHAYLSKPVVYWQNTITGQIKMGFPEQFNPPPYHNKIVCQTVHDAERWSQLMRDQERVNEQVYADTRGAYEETLRSHLRKEIHHRLAQTSDPVNRGFLEAYLKKIENRPSDPTQSRRESYLHNEGFEQGR